MIRAGALGEFGRIVIERLWREDVGGNDHEYTNLVQEKEARLEIDKFVPQS
jgi:hypothetical protein